VSIVLALLAAGGPPRARAATSGCPAEVDCGPLFFFGPGIEGGARTTAAGPVFERKRVRGGGELHAVRPLYSRLTEEQRDRVLHEFLWPVGMLKLSRGESTWRFLTAYGQDFDVADDKSRWRAWLLPLAYAGRSAEGERYAAVFPLGGRICEFLGYDRIEFFLFPLWSRTAVNDIRAGSVLWPLVTWGEGEGVRRFRFFPFYGYSAREGRWHKRFVLWPLWTSARYDYPGGRGSGFVLFPLCGYAATENGGRTWMALPPFFRYSHGAGQTVLNCPWPFIRLASGERERCYLWPLWGRKQIGPVRSWFCLWPVFSGETVERPETTVRRFVALPFVRHEVQRAAAEDPASPGKEDGGEAVRARRLKLWPLFRYRRTGEDRECRALALWPFGDVGGVDRNISPFWTLYRDECAAGARETELLWGLYRYRRQADGNRRVALFPLFAAGGDGDSGERREWELLKGLYRCRREGLRTSRRLLYFFNWQRGEEPSDADP
jgi:hypothetical protein